MSILNELEKTKAYLRNARKAVLGRGGEISETAGLKDLPSAIFNIPADASLAYYTDDTSAYKKTVPSGAEDYAQLKSVGGMTRESISPNILEGAGANGFIFNGHPYFYTLESGKYRLDVFNKPEGCTASITLYYQDDWIATYSEGQVADLRKMNGHNHDGYWVNIYIQGVNYGDVIYPVFYKLPDDDESYKLTEYVPYGEMLVPTPVTEIVSMGKNLLSPDWMKLSNWENIEANKWFYPLDLPDGWYCISIKVKKPFSSVYFYIQGSTGANGGFTTQQNVYVDYGSISNGYMAAGDKVNNYALWFNVDNKAGRIYRLYSPEMTQGTLDYIYDVQIERVDLAQEPSASYPPATYAPPTEYKPYSAEPIDTVVIPDEVLPLEGYGADNAYIDFTRKVFVYGDNETDISKYKIPKFIKVEGNGILIFKNEAQADVPSSIKYVQKVGT